MTLAFHELCEAAENGDRKGSHAIYEEDYQQENRLGRVAYGKLDRIPTHGA